MPSTPSCSEKDLFIIARGLPASTGAVTGQVAFSADEALARSQSGEDVILVRPQTLAEDVPAMMASKGVVCLLGGLTCHGAIVARDLKKPCIVGCSGLRLLEDHLEAEVEGKTIQLFTGDIIRVDGALGEISLPEPASA
jgi:pyruvate, orthophosphate dikinase